jgi:hypothetical protein
MKKFLSIGFLTAVALAVFIAAGCAEQRKIIIKPSGEEISDIQTIINQIGLKDWRGPLSDMKEKITDQLGRTQNGLKNGDITNVHGAEIIAKVQDIVQKIDGMTGSYAGKHPHSAGGENEGGYGEDNGYSAGGNSTGGDNGNGNSGSGAYGGGRHRHGGRGGNPVNSDLSDRTKDIADLKDMVDAYYTTSTARALTTTAQAATAEAGNTTTTANTR